MTFSGRRLLRVISSGCVALAMLALAACGVSSSASSGTGSRDAITVGTTNRVTSVDPAGSYDTGSFDVQMQVLPFLYFPDVNGEGLRPFVASDDGSWNADGTAFTVHIRKGMRWANGHTLDSKDVKFTFDRIKAIDDPKGPAYLLKNQGTVDAPNPTTVVFHSNVPYDVTLKKILGGSPASPIVDDEVFSATELTPASTIIKANAFAGPYRLTSFVDDQSASYVRNKDYQGPEPAKNPAVRVRYFADESNLKLAVQQGQVDVAYHSLSPTDVEDLSHDRNLRIIRGQGGEERSLAFNFRTQPYGEKQPDANPNKAAAVRHAVADLVDRKALARDVFKGMQSPLYSFIPNDATGAKDILKTTYGDGKGGPSLKKARQTLADAGVRTPVHLNIQYNADHYSAISSDEYVALKAQLETGGLFDVTIQQTEWSQYSVQRLVTKTSDGAYPLFQVCWGPDFIDPDTYLTPFFRSDSTYVSNGYSNPRIDALLRQQVSEQDEDARNVLLEQIQTIEAQDLSVLPLLQETKTVVASKRLSGVTLDASTRFRFAPMVKAITA